MRYRVKGLRHTIAATDRMGKDVKRLARKELRDAVQPVRDEAARLFDRYDARSAAKYGVTVRRAGSVVVEQRLRRTTGQHPEFGSLQMRKALIPALASKEDEVVERIDDALGRIAVKWGVGG